MVEIQKDNTIEKNEEVIMWESIIKINAKQNKNRWVESRWRDKKAIIQVYLNSSHSEEDFSEESQDSDSEYSSNNSSTDGGENYMWSNCKIR